MAALTPEQQQAKDAEQQRSRQQPDQQHRQSGTDHKAEPKSYDDAIAAVARGTKALCDAGMGASDAGNLAAFLYTGGDCPMTARRPTA